MLLFLSVMLKFNGNTPFRVFDGSVKGRGGTDLEPVFKEASERHFDALIYFTDAFAPKVKENYSIPVLGDCCLPLGSML
ncbi:MAG: hypothetical protein J5858_03830 [Lentisphaeria bacterium]|nr:hypothetical protein [Lentisphaeria bacterium]